MSMRAVLLAALLAAAAPVQAQEHSDLGGEVQTRAVGERAEQGKTLHPFPPGERKMLRDESAHRMSDDMDSIDAFGVDNGERIASHALDRQRPVSTCVGPDAAIVEGDEPECGREAIDLWTPAPAHDADALNGEHARAGSGHDVRHVAV